MDCHYLKKECRLCKSSHLIKVLGLTPTGLCDAYVKEKRQQQTYPLDLFQCVDCKFVQIECVVDPEIIYRDYIYVTTSSSGLSSHFESYADEVSRDIGLKKNSFVIDIGSNDGTLLNYFKMKNCRVLGIEPSNKTAQEATDKGIKTLPEFFTPDLAVSIKNNYGEADLITINNLYANVDDLYLFTEGLISMLALDGVLVIESSYLLDMVENMVFDFIYHEHLSYFSILPLVKFFSKFNMKLIRITHVPTKGGSLRYFWARENSSFSIDESVAIFTEKEKKKKIDRLFFEEWENRINIIKIRLLETLNKYKDKTITGYGASATSTTLIYHFGLDKYLTYLIDDNPGKIGTFSPGLNIPVESSEKLKFESSDVVLVLAWRYFELIKMKLKGKKVRLICPLPEIKEVIS
ncbi:class I SAM-dependent methyltransferase [Leptospira kirschneri]|uniref:class I SAM-dependent methyltransferase n=1 Tax=Leptospira kirschneri TaxID=29507 RepID=UPI0002D320BF|nr:class I SAM-dependent methyltransferase [Leptospira kirschneri]